MSFIIQHPDGRKLRFEGDKPPTQDVIDEAFKLFPKQSDAFDPTKPVQLSDSAMAQNRLLVPEQFTPEAPLEDNGKGRMRSAGESLMQEGGVNAGQTVSGFARIMQKILGPQEPENDIGYEPPTAQEREAEVAASPVYKAGQALAEGAKEAYQPNPKFKGEFLTDTLPRGAGGMVPMVALGAVNPALAAAQYGLSQGQQETESAIAAGDLEDADKVFLMNAGIGAASEFALGVPARILKFVKAARAAKMTAKEAGETLLKAMRNAAVFEGTQEGLESAGQNVIAQQSYDPNRSLMDGVFESAAAGAVLGPVFAGGAHLVGSASVPSPAKLAGQYLNQATKDNFNSDQPIIFGQQPQDSEGVVDRANRFYVDNPEVAGGFTPIDNLVDRSRNGQTVDAANNAELSTPVDTSGATTPIDSLMARNRSRIEQEQQRANRPPRPTVPEMGGQERISGVDEIRRAGATTLAQIQALWPDARLTREQARVWRDAAWGNYKPQVSAATTPAATTAEIVGQDQPQQRKLRALNPPTPKPPQRWSLLPPASPRSAPRLPLRSDRSNSPTQRESIGRVELASLGEAVARKAVSDVLGNVPSNVRFIQNPDAPAGRIVMKPGTIPAIELNLSRLSNEDSVRDVLYEELIHNVWTLPELADARGIIEGLVSDALVSKKRSEGYTDGVAGEEAANQLTRELYQTHADSNVFKRALNNFVLAVKRVFGVQLNERDAALLIVKKALRNRESTASSERFAIQPFKSRSAVEQMTGAERIDPDGKAALDELASVQSGMFDPATAEPIIRRVSAETTNGAEAFERKLLSPVAKLIQVSANPKNLASISDPSQRAAASYVAVGQHFTIQEQRSKIAEIVSQAEGEMASAVNEMKDLSAHTARARMLNALASDLPDSYALYLKNVIATEKPGSNLAATAKILLQRAAIRAGDSVVSPGAVMRAIESIADNPVITTEDSTAKEILLQVWRKGGETGVSPDTSLALFGDENGNGVNGLIPVLARARNLPAIISSLRKIKSNTAKAQSELQAFRQSFNPSGRAVTPQSALRRYAKLLQEAKESDTIVRTLSARYEKARSRLLGAEAALAAIDNLVSTPHYRQSLGSAAAAIGVTLDGLFTETTGEVRLKGPITERDYIISRVPSKEQETRNRQQVEDLLLEIGQLINDPQADPILKRTWNSIGERISAQWLESISSPMESKVEPYDLKALFPWLRTQQGLFEQIGGRQTLDARRMFQAVDALGDKLQAEERNAEYGFARHSVLLAAAMQSHGMDPKSPHDVTRYERVIGNPLLSSLQHHAQVKLGIGKFVPFTSHRISAEDIAVAKSQFDFEQAVRKRSEKDMEIYGSPSRILDQVASSKFRRQSVPTGPMTSTRFIYDWARDWVSQNWRTGLGEEARAEQIKTLWQQLDSDPDLFRDVVVGYIRETSPEFKRDSVFEKEFRLLTLNAREQNQTLSSFEDLVEALGPMRTEPREALRVKLRDALTKEISAILDRFSDKVTSENQLRDVDEVERAVFQSLRTEGSFLKPRGNMIAPSTFFQYAKAASRDLAKVPAIAKNIARARAIEGMQNVLGGLIKLRGMLEADLARLENSASAPKTRTEALNAQGKMRRLGEIRFTIPELDRKIGAIRAEIKKAGNTIQAWDEDFSPTVVQTASMLNRGIILQLLGSPGAILNNVVGGLGGNDLILNAHMRGLKHTLFSPFAMSAHTWKTGIAGVLRSIENHNPKLAGIVKQAMPFAEGIGVMAEKNARMMQRLMDAGIITPFDWKNRRDAKKAVGFGGEAVKEGDEPPAHLKAMKHVYTTPPLMLQEALFPRKFDNMINLVQSHRTYEILLDLASRAENIGKVRAVTGRQLNPADATQTILPEELEMNERQLHWLRTYLEPVASLESLLFDYYQRLNAVAADQRGNVPFVNEQQLEALIRSFGQHGNVVRESNSPASFRGGAVRRIVGSLGSYPANLLDQLLKVVPRGGEPNHVAQLGNLLLFAALMALVGIILKELRTEAVETYTGKLSGQPRLANLSNDPLSLDNAAYLATALSSTIPYIGLATEKIFSNGGSRSLFDLSETVPMLAWMRDVGSMVRTAAQSGDVTRPLAEFGSRYFPLYAPAINRLPVITPAIRAADSLRALRAATPRDIPRRNFSGDGGAVANPTSQILRSAELASIRGDSATSKSELEKAIAQTMKDHNLSRIQAEARVRSALASRSPDNRVFGRKLTALERSRIFQTMTRGQRAAYDKGERAFTSLRSALPSNPKLKSFSPSTTKQNRKFRSFP